MPLLVHGEAPRLGIHNLWPGWKEMLASPLNVTTNEDVVRGVSHLQHLTYEWGNLRKSPYTSVAIGELTSAEWDSFEKEWLPVLYPTKHDVGEKFSKARHKLVAELESYGFGGDMTMGDAAAAFKAQSIQAAHSMIRQAYQRDPMGFIKLFHADAANLGLQLHYYFDPKKEYKEFGQWIPADIAQHIEAMFPFSGWAARRTLAMPAGLHQRLFRLGADEEGQQRFHVALPLKEARTALALLLGENTARALPLKTADGGGVVITLGADQYHAIGEKLGNLLPANAAAPDGAPLPQVSEVHKAPAVLKQNALG